jgi:hypothetical protein
MNRIFLGLEFDIGRNRVKCQHPSDLETIALSFHNRKFSGKRMCPCIRHGTRRGDGVAESQSDFERRLEAQAAVLVATKGFDIETVRELLILECHSSPTARRFFENHIDNREILAVLIQLAIDDYSGDAQMNASYWISRFPVGMLKVYITQLETIASNEWDSVAVHARKSLEAVKAAN